MSMPPVLSLLILAALATASGFATISVSAEKDWSTCPLPAVLQDNCCQSLESVVDQGEAWFQRNYLDQRPALVTQDSTDNDAARWSGRYMMREHPQQQIQVISVPQKKSPSPSTKASEDQGAGVRGKPISMAMVDFVEQFLGCTAANATFVHVRPYVFSGAREWLKVLNYTYPKLQLGCRPPEPSVQSRMNFERILAPMSGVQDYVYIEYFSLGGTGTGLRFHRHQEAWTETFYGRKLWLLHEPHCELAQIWSAMSANCPRGRCDEATQGADGGGGLVLDTYVKKILPSLPERGTTNSTCYAKPIVVLQTPGTIVYLPALW